MSLRALSPLLRHEVKTRNSTVELPEFAHAPPGNGNLDFPFFRLPLYSTNGSVGSASYASGSGNPAASRNPAAAAIIAALSVQ